LRKENRPALHRFDSLNRQLEANMQSIRVRTARRTQMVDVTQQVQRIVTAVGVKVGTCYLYVPHTTAGVLINEHADPDVASDAEGALDRLVPSAGPYRHAEGNSDSHVKTMLVGTSLFVFVEDGKLARNQAMASAAQQTFHRFMAIK